MSARRSRKEIRPGSGAGLGAEPEPGDVAGGTGMAERWRRPEHRVGLLLDASGPRGRDAVEQLRSTLGATVTDPDDNGVFEAIVPADSFEAALERVWDAVAAAGLDDRLRFMEHPEMPEHWRARQP